MQAKDTKITLTNWRTSCAVQTVLELNIYRLEIIERAVKKLLDDRKNKFDSSALLDVIFQNEKKAATKDVCTIAANKLTLAPCQVNTRDAQTSEVQTLKEEIETLTSRRICTICMDLDISTLFLPCRHLVCCMQCGEKIRYCSVCRRRVVATIEAKI